MTARVMRKRGYIARWSVWLCLLSAGCALLLLAACRPKFGSAPAELPQLETTRADLIAAAPTPVILSVVYADDFADQASGWDDAFDTYTMKQYGGHKYHIEVNAANLFAWGLANRNISDFVLEVKAQQEDGPDNSSYGIIFRWQDRGNFYRYDITADGFFLLSKYVNGQWLTLIDWTPSPAIHKSRGENELRVLALGPHISIYCNGTLLGSVTDSSFRQGDIGFFASAFDQAGVHVSFDDLVVWAPPGATIARRTPSPMSALQAAFTITRSEPSTVSSPASAPALPTGLGSPLPSETPTQPSNAPSLRLGPSPTAIVLFVPSTSPSPITSPTHTSTLPGAASLPGYVSAVQPRPKNALVLGGKIAYPAFDSTRGTYDIYLVNPATRETQKLIENASQPALSPNGQYIAYRSWANEKRGLISRDLKGTEIWRFTTYSEAGRPSWSPRGDFYVYHSRQESDRISRLFRTRGDQTEGIRREGEVVKGEAPDFLDAETIVYKGCLGTHCGLITMRLDGSSATQITDNLTDTNPAASPDGRKIAFMSQRTGKWDIFVMNRDGSGLVNLTPNAFNQGLPAWSPDGQSIAFVAERAGEWGIWIMGADGSNPYQLVPLPGTLDARVRTAQPAESVGWLEERLSWSP